MQAVAQAGCPINLFIDALDEGSDTEVRAMIYFLEQLAAQSQSCGLRVCLACRHYPHISVQKGLYILMEKYRGHIDDIGRFIDISLNKNLLSDLRESMLRLSEGVFL